MTSSISLQFVPPAYGEAEARFRDAVESLVPREAAFRFLIVASRNGTGVTEGSSL